MTKETVLQKEITDALNEHPNVVFCRNNTVGTAKVRGHYITIGHKYDLDVYGMRRPDGRYFEIEVKRPGEEKTNPERVKEQLDRIVKIRNGGGLSGFVTSVEEALRVVLE